MVFPKKPVDDSVENIIEVCTCGDGNIPEIADVAGVPTRTATVNLIEPIKLCI